MTKKKPTPVSDLNAKSCDCSSCKLINYSAKLVAPNGKTASLERVCGLLSIAAVSAAARAPTLDGQKYLASQVIAKVIGMLSPLLCQETDDNKGESVH
jgi:hypothetical protein